MSNRHFCNREAMHQCERWKESVHALEEADAFEHGASEYLERTSGVMNTIVGKKVPHTVGDPGRHFFYQTILPILPPSAHEIVGFSIGEKLQDVLAVLLKVAVDLDDDVAGRLTESRFERAGLAVISVEMEHPNLGVLLCQAIQCFATAVVAAVVHENDFERPSLRGRVRIHDSQQSFDQRNKIVSFILDRNDDRRPWMGWHGHAG